MFISMHMLTCQCDQKSIPHPCEEASLGTGAPKPTRTVIQLWDSEFGFKVAKWNKSFATAQDQSHANKKISKKSSQRQAHLTDSQTTQIHD
jgi:hypothetical protein